MAEHTSAEARQAALAEVVEEALKVGSALGMLADTQENGTAGLVSAKASERLAGLYREYGDAEEKRVDAAIKMCKLMLQLQEFFPNVRWPLDFRYWEEKKKQLYRLKVNVKATTLKRVREIQQE